jgi:DNA mismatch repair protein MutL
MTIRILDDALANKIAAGEVIERPASVIKELVENALDAGASEVEVVVEEAGRKLIQVTDNGAGMTRDDAVLALQRHATSKIATTDDLFAIRTLGFRGEALPSIVAVSHFRLVTRPATEEIGTELLASGGTIAELREIGGPPGTQVSVRQLFFNTPARLKFLKSDQAEFGAITELLNALSICHHTVTFRLLHNGRTILSRPSSAQILAPISTWLGREVADAMVPVALETPGVTVRGVVGKPAVARGNRTGQLLFINGRRILNRMLTHALESAFAGLLLPGRFPVGVLTITMDPGGVDVNVHPAKAEVRFHREGEMHAVVARAVKEALGNTSLTHTLAAGYVATPASARRSFAPLASLPTLPLPADAATPLRPPTPALTPASAGVPVPDSGLRAIGQFHGTYLLAEGRDALLLINQHRAHERVLFEELWAQVGHVLVQGLVLPVTLHLGHREALLLEDHREALTAFGFDLAPLSGQSYLLRAVPAPLAALNPDTLLREILADLDGHLAIAPFAPADPARRALEEGRRRLLAAIACKGAIKAGKLLTAAEQQELLARLQATEQPSLCPHGGPIILTLTQYELDRKFVR